MALKKIENELGLKLMPKKEETNDIPTAKGKYALIDTILCLSDIQKMLFMEQALDYQNKQLYILTK